jgi:amidohydrolase
MSEQLKASVSEEIDSLESRIIKISDAIHDEPELGYQEYKASELLTSVLKEFDFSVVKGVAGLPTSFKATIGDGSEGPTVALLAEYDALPELGHACGHNIIAAAAVGAAIGLAKKMQDLDGTLIVFGTPAEEGYTENAGGKVLMANEIGKTDAALMIHPSSIYHVNSTSLAREAFRVVFTGKAAHAGVSPEEGVNALEGVLLTFQGINALRQHIPRDVRVHGIITDGGMSPNVVPEYAAAHLYVRAPDLQVLNEIVERVKNCARGAASATGAGVKFMKTCQTYANIKRNRVLTDIFEANLMELGIDVPSEERVSGGSTDFGNISQAIPSACAWISIGEDVVLHSRECAEVTASDVAHKALIIASKALAHTVIDIFTQPDLIENMRWAFNQTSG